MSYVHTDDGGTLVVPVTESGYGAPVKLPDWIAREKIDRGEAKPAVFKLINKDPRFAAVIDNDAVVIPRYDPSPDDPFWTTRARA